MVRPRKQQFYEIELPDTLLPQEEWLRDFHKNSRSVIEYLISKNVKPTSYYEASRCLTVLRQYLIDNQLPYSFENAAQWLANNYSSKKTFVITLNRLRDFYEYGHIHPGNAFPKVMVFSDRLNPYWFGLFEQFFSTESCYDYPQKRQNVSRFLYEIQEVGISDLSQITYDQLKDSIINTYHSSDSAKSIYAHAAGEFLKFAADRQLCSHCFTWFPYLLIHEWIVSTSDMCLEQIERINAVREESGEFGSDDFAELIPEFIKELTKHGYTETPMKTAVFALHNLAVFVDMHNLGYHPVIADIWVEYTRDNWHCTGWKQYRRVFFLFNQFIEQNSVIPQLLDNRRPLKIQMLPEWCRMEADNFLALKEKEGWRKSTLDMLRSSVTRFCSFLAKYGLNSFEEITPPCIKEFNRSDHHMTVEGKTAYNSRIRQFLKYLERKNVITSGIHLALCGGAVNTEQIVTILSDSDIESILIYGSHAVTPKELLNYAIVMIGLMTGLRASDVVRIKFADIDWNNQSIRVLQEKTEREIIVHFPTEVGNAIYRYIKNGRAASQKPYLFIKNRVPFDSYNPTVCRRALYTILPELKGQGFHITRRTFATRQLKKGTGYQYVSDLLGHRDTSSLHHYLNHDEAKMRMCPITLDEAGISCSGFPYD